MAKVFASPPRQPGWNTDADNSEIIVFNAGSGNAAVGTNLGGLQIVNTFGTDLVISDVRARVITAPTGATLICDVNIGGTTIFTTQGNRPTIAISGTTSTTVAPNVTSWPVGGVLSVDVDQVGSTVAGAGLTVQVTAVSSTA